MTITLPVEQDRFIGHLVAAGRFATPDAAVSRAVALLEDQETGTSVLVAPLSPEDADRVYAADEEWDKVEVSLAGLATPEV
ncbi:MAG: ribbon-helix-helix domain-containing protein [Prosthecobacter sp.]